MARSDEAEWWFNAVYAAVRTYTFCGIGIEE